MKKISNPSRISIHLPGSGSGAHRRRSSVRESAFQQQQYPSSAAGASHPASASFDYTGSTGSLYDLSGAEMPQTAGDHHCDENSNGSRRKQRRRKLSGLHRRQRQDADEGTEDIWRHVARASHDNLLHTRNPAYGFQDQGQQQPGYTDVGDDEATSQVVETTTAEESVAQECRRRTVVTQRTTTVNAGGTGGRVSGGYGHGASSGSSGSGGSGAYRIPRAATGLQGLPPPTAAAIREKTRL